MKKKASQPNLSELVLEGASETQLKVAIHSGANLNQQDESGNTALHYACAANNTTAIQTLILAGAEVGLVNKEGKTPINLIVPVQMQGSHLGADATPERAQASGNECDAVRDEFIRAMQQRARYEARMHRVKIHETGTEGVVARRR